MRIVCIGDSVTYGQHAEDHCYSVFLQEILDAESVLNFGVCGDTTRLGLERFPTVQDLRPDVCVIQFGYNDCNHWDTDGGLPRVSQEAFEANLKEMLGRCRKFDIQPLLVPMYRAEPSGKPFYPSWQGRHLRALERISRRTLETPDLLDGLHPSPAGHRQIAEEIASWIRSSGAERSSTRRSSMSRTSRQATTR